MKRPYHHGDLRRALLEATLAIVVDTGPRGVTVREVARRAGVSHTASYRHFADKDELLAAVAEEGFKRLARTIRAAMDAAPDTASKFRESGLAYIEFARANPEHYRIMFGDAVSFDALGFGEEPPRFPALQEAARETFQVLLDAVAACQAEGIIRPRDTRDAAMVAWTMCHGVSTLLVDGHLPPRAIGVVFEAMCFGLIVPSSE